MHRIAQIAVDVVLDGKMVADHLRMSGLVAITVLVGFAKVTVSSSFWEWSLRLRIVVTSYWRTFMLEPIHDSIEPFVDLTNFSPQQLHILHKFH